MPLRQRRISDAPTRRASRYVACRTRFAGSAMLYHVPCRLIYADAADGGATRRRAQSRRAR